MNTRSVSMADVARVSGSPLLSTRAHPIRRTNSYPRISTPGERMIRRIIERAEYLLRVARETAERIYEQCGIRLMIDWLVGIYNRYGITPAAEREIANEIYEQSSYGTADTLFDTANNTEEAPTIEDLGPEEELDRQPTFEEIKKEKMNLEKEKMQLENEKIKQNIEHDDIRINMKVEEHQVSIERTEKETKKTEAEKDKIEIETTRTQCETEKLNAETAKIDEETRKLRKENELEELSYQKNLLKIVIEQENLAMEYQHILKRKINLIDVFSYLCMQMIGQQFTEKTETQCASIIRNYFEKTKSTDYTSMLHTTRIVLRMFSIDKKFSLQSYFMPFERTEITEYNELKKNALDKSSPYKTIKNLKKINKLRSGQATKSFLCFFKKNVKLTDKNF